MREKGCGAKNRQRERYEARVREYQIARVRDTVGVLLREREDKRATFNARKGRGSEEVHGI